ncbi:MAG: hypothetical protein CO150_03060 [Nitrospirae bacterium CG_4_9_14_3_um_filter_53_35]|nr:MAG: hypothetical protein AUK29_00650 [Nitrospirae bacterium CG2_30_53_67]PIS36257.1 MAG: hypothetical protein COT35_12130 [Nitrospirae bacterium CG08_land_8_20_14_0_20_52_24]PIW85379.1 MAG: hypothetical protein COZ95_04870 [Nitrospirae bacterium CG_4_8_14_3_um_filter_50_41]PJA76528.1 MAG: hypothetical protein CO150_03060 [Nitrospirae bacterium CG_4_9_14_3_um_filter_53_35]
MENRTPQSLFAFPVLFDLYMGHVGSDLHIAQFSYLTFQRLDFPVQRSVLQTQTVQTPGHLIHL